ncbi:MAG: hypothetical protein KAI47_24520, partial [Deltaproteobacteria bacterium]|nr:hypothetical protein [Deltaproteobacteria bacterium]
ETRVLEIVPTSIGNSRRVGPDWGSQHEKWAWSTLAPNGKLYAVACNRDQVLEIDPADLTATGIRLVGPVLSHTDIHKYFAASVASNGKLYAFPWYGTSKILEIDTHARGHFDRDLLLNGHLNGQ